MNKMLTSEPVTVAPAQQTAQADFIKRLVASARQYQGTNRRSEPRHTLGVAVRVAVVNEAHKIIGADFVAVTRDISARGVALYHTQPVTDKLLAVEFELPGGEKRRLLLDVLRCRPVGPLFEVAGQFIA